MKAFEGRLGFQGPLLNIENPYISKQQKVSSAVSEDMAK